MDALIDSINNWFANYHWFFENQFLDALTIGSIPGIICFMFGFDTQLKFNVTGCQEVDESISFFIQIVYVLILACLMATIFGYIIKYGSLIALPVLLIGGIIAGIQEIFKKSEDFY